MLCSALIDSRDDDIPTAANWQQLTGAVGLEVNPFSFHARGD